jgi:hypothetical protein
MKRAIARGQTWWVRLFVLAVLTSIVLPDLFPHTLVAAGALFGLALVRAPRSAVPPIDVAPPVRGRWVAVNSPGSAVPSHGVRAYGQMYAVDLLQTSTDSTTSIGWSLRTRAPQSYPCFGAPVLAMVPGTVIRSVTGQRDHRARDTWPALIWMMTVEGFLRELAGAPRILGNHLIVEHDDGTYAAYAHLRQGSATVRVGERLTTGQRLASVGNTGNTSEPHLHVQLMNHPYPTAAAGIPMHWPGLTINNDETDPRWAGKPPRPTALPDFPRNGQIFQA